MPEPEASAGDLALLTAAAIEAGEIALRHFRHDPAAWEKPQGAGPVTEADLEVDRHLRVRLLAARPGAGWLSEETGDTPERLGREEVFVVDPIDGTRAFVAGQPDWAHSLALVRGGRVAAGVVHLPARGLTYAAAAGGPATLNGRPIHASSRAGIAGARVLTRRRQPAGFWWRGDPPPFERHFRPSLAWRLALVAEGRFDAMLTLADAWEWDVAAGVLIAAAAGARVTTRDGAVPRFNQPRPLVPGLVAAGKAVHSSLLSALAPPGGAEPAGSV